MACPQGSGAAGALGRCVLCEESGDGFLVLSGKAVCPGCFTALLVQSERRLARLREEKCLSGGRERSSAGGGAENPRPG